MKIEIDTNNPADVKALLSLLGGASTEDSVERTEKFLAAAEEKPKKRGPGRPRMTDEEKAEAARKRAEEKKQKQKEEAAAAAAAAAADEDDDDEDDEPADEGRALALDDGEDDAEDDASDSDEDDSDDADGDEDPMEKAVALATQYLRDGNGKEVRRALKQVGASRVSDLKGKKVQEFLDLIESI